MILFLHSTADGISDEYYVTGGKYLFLAQGELGGGTVTLEYKMDQIPDFIEMSAASFTTDNATVVALAAGYVRAHLEGSSGADLNVGLSKLEETLQPPVIETVELLDVSMLDESVSVLRSGNATVRNSNGTWETVSPDTARFHHNKLGEMLGLLAEGTRTNYLHDSENPSTQTVNLVNTEYFTLWMEGTGSVSVTGNSATGSGFGTATEGSPVTFYLSSTGTVDVSVSGSLERFQLERHRYPTTYISTPPGSNVTRDADYIRVTDISDWYSDDGTTFLVRGYGPPNDADTPHVIVLNDGTSQNRLRIRRDSTGIMRAEAITNDIVEASLEMGAVSFNEPFSVAFRITRDAIAASRNGGAVVSAPNITLPEVDRLDIGFSVDRGFWYSPLRLVQVHEAGVSDAELQSLSAFSGQIPDPNVGATDIIEPIEGKDTSDPTVNQPSKPAKGSTYTDQDYAVPGMTYRRITDAHSDIAPNYFLTVTYSRRNPFNADGTRILLESADPGVGSGSENMHILDPNTGTIIHSPFYTGPDSARSYTRLENVWHYTNPNLMFALAADPYATDPPSNDLYKVNVLDLSNVTDGVPARTVIIDFTDVGFAVETGHEMSTSILDVWSNAFRIWTALEGTPSKAVVGSGPYAGYPRYWAFQVEKAGDPRDAANGLGAITYDLEINTVTGVLDYSSINRSGANHVDMSPSGEYIAVGWADENACASETTGTFSNPCGLMIYNRDFSNGFGLYSGAPHADFSIDKNGNDVYVWVDFDTARIRYTVCDTRDIYDIFDFDFPVGGDIHVSGTAINAPGYILLSPYDSDADVPPTTDQWYHDKIIVAEIVPTDAKLWVLGHTYNGYSNDDRSAPHATANYDLTRIAWGSNWAPRTDGLLSNTDTYVIEIDGEFPS